MVQHQCLRVPDTWNLRERVEWSCAWAGIRQLRLWPGLRIITAIGLMAAGLRRQTQPPCSSSYKIAFDHIRGGESELGVRELEALGASFPRDAVLATSIGAALDSDSRHQQAAQWYEKALAIDPQYEPALNNLALSLASRGLLEDAVPLLRSDVLSVARLVPGALKRPARRSEHVPICGAARAKCSGHLFSTRACLSAGQPGRRSKRDTGRRLGSSPQFGSAALWPGDILRAPGQL